MVLESLTQQASRREPTAEELRGDLLALPSGELIPLFERPAEEPRVIAQAPPDIWD
jgi:hypothetical protein